MTNSQQRGYYRHVNKMQQPTIRPNESFRRPLQCRRHVPFHPRTIPVYIPTCIYRQRSSVSSSMCDAFVIRSRSDSLCLHLIRVSNNLIRRALNDAARLWELCSDTHEIDIDVASCLATLIDAPSSNVSMSPLSHQKNKTYQTIKLCPRRQSPAANTPGRLVLYFPGGVLIFFLASFSTSLPSIRSSGPKKPIEIRTS